MDYRASSFRSNYRSNGATLNTNGMDVQLLPGLNFGAWRLRNLTTAEAELTEGKKMADLLYLCRTWAV